MKKIYQFASILVLGLLFVQCGGDDDASRNTPTDTLMVNSVGFPVGTNASGALYNTTMSHTAMDADDYNMRTFTIVKRSATTEEDADFINLFVFYQANESINGTYAINVDEETIMNDHPNYGMCSFINETDEFGSTPGNSSGTVTITDNGNSNFKIVFNNVVLNNGTEGGNKAITGYCSTTFAPL